MSKDDKTEKTMSNTSEYSDKEKEISHLLNVYGDLLHLLNEVRDPNQVIESKDPRYQNVIGLFDKLHELMLSAGIGILTFSSKGRTFALAADEDGFFIPTMKDLRKRKRKSPDRKWVALGTAKELKTGNEGVVAIDIGKRLFVKKKPKTDSREKELSRKRAYYSRHKVRLLKYQKEYDEDHKPHIHWKNKYYYMLKNEGISQDSNIADLRFNPSDDIVMQLFSTIGDKYAEEYEEEHGIE